KPPPTPEKKPPSKPKLPDELQKKLQKQVEEKKQAAKHDSKAEQLEAALQAPSEGKVDSVGDAVSNIDAANSPTEESTKKVGGVLKGIEGDGVNVAGGGAENLGDIGSGVGESTGKLAQRKKDENVRAQVDSVESLADVEGKLSRGKIVSVIDGRQGDIQGCYEKELLSNPGLGGKITFEWTIQPDGTVTNARQIHSSMGHAPVSNCILKILRSLTFPKPKGGSVTIQFPFMFRSG
ncbi:MAG: AgmX/PglI C-terminal domain-containing protein, partial [Bradymonadaceae bacterium]